MPEEALPDYAVRNRAKWTISNARYTAGRARESWSQDVHWGVWHVPEADVRRCPMSAGST